MGLAIDTPLGVVTNSTTLKAVSFATGDSGTVRSFNAPATASLEQILTQGSQSITVQVTSPMLHDNVRGITFITAESPSRFLMPREIGQGLQSQDTLAVETLSGSANSTLVALVNYYSDLGGTAARLHSWADISGNIKFIKPVTVAVTSSATIGQWADTLITTTEDLLHANKDYAVLGYVTDTALLAVGVKGQETGNLRVCGPGVTTTDDTSDFFVFEGDRMGTPHIPVINSANKNSIYVSVAANTASVDANISLILAELVTNLST